MFPLQRSNELFFEISSNSRPQHKIPPDLILSRTSTDGITDIIINSMSKNRRRKLCVVGSDHDRFGSENKKKKMMHRDTERHRRQQMATLYSSLRCLLPLELIKGKRSISDQMNEAVHYIKHLQKNIKELTIKRDTLKKMSESSYLGPETQDHASSCVIIRPSFVGVEIVVSSCVEAQGLCLSSVLQVILEEALSVLTCASTRVDDRILHTIHIQVSDPECFNLSRLQEKLTQME